MERNLEMSTMRGERVEKCFGGRGYYCSMSFRGLDERKSGGLSESEIEQVDFVRELRKSGSRSNVTHLGRSVGGCDLNLRDL